MLMIDDMLEETWKELGCGAKEKEHPFRVGSLATMDSEGHIKQRMVNLRKLTKENHLLFYTDVRSHKIYHIDKNPNASVIFYNPNIHLQVYINGTIIIHTDDKLWENHKSKIEGKSINDYNTQYPPGKKINNPLNVQRTNEINFALLELVPQSIEYLKLRTEPNRIRAVFTKEDEEWNKSFLIP